VGEDHRSRAEVRCDDIRARHGFVDSPAVLKEELETFRKAIVQVIAEGKRLKAAGLDAEAAAEQAKFGDLEGWTLRSSQGAIAIRRVFLELEGNSAADFELRTSNFELDL
jgi:hypothetical protein